MNKNLFLICLILVGLAAALISFEHRFATEARNRRVELVIDWADAQALANTTTSPIGDVLTRLKQAGITTVAVTEETLDLLRANGILTYHRDGADTILTFATGFPGQKERVAQVLAHKTGLSVSSSGSDSLRVTAPWPQFNGVPIGLDAEVVATIRRNELLVAPRLLNYTGANTESIGWDLAQAKALCGANGTGPLIFAGAAVLGNRAFIRSTADQFASLGLIYGSVEFGKMLGDDELSRMASAQTVRVHSIGSEEMGTMEEPTAQERFVRAARERNIRVCYIRLFTNGLKTNQNVIQANTDYIRNIAKGLDVAKLTIGPAHPYDTDPKPGKPLSALMALGIAAGGLLLLRIFTGLSGRAFWGVLIAAMLLAVAISVTTSPKGREILALAAACTFPTLGLCGIRLPKHRIGDSISAGTALAKAFIVYAQMTGVTFAGIVFIAGILSGRLFLLKVDEFLGVKTVLVAPVLLTALYYGLGLADLSREAGFKERLAHAIGRGRDILSQPLSIGQLVAGVVGLVAIGLFVARSGNDPGVGVSPTELHVRALLDKYLLVRPRTKEFLFGHPALLFGLAAAAGGRFPRWTLLLLIFGAVGQSSMLDTFCHLHTPLFLSLLRASIGWLLGAMIGSALYVAASRADSRRASAEFSNSGSERSAVESGASL